MKILPFIISGYLLIYLQPAFAQQHFVLEGSLKGYAAGTRILICPTLPNMATNTDQDTTIFLKDGKFRLEGSIKMPLKYHLRVMPAMLDENPANYESVMFWIEPGQLQLDGVKGNLAFAKVTGSIIQDEYWEYVNTGKAMQQVNKRIKDSVITKNLPEEERLPLRKTFNRNAAAIDMERVEFIYLHPSYLSCVAELVYYINFQPERLSKKKTAGFYQSLSHDFKHNIYGVQIKEYIGKSGGI